MSTTRSKSRLLGLAFISALAIGLVGCSDAASPSADPGGSPVDNDAAIADVAWGEDAFGLPVLTFDSPFVVSEPAARLIADGDGAALEQGQVLALDYVAFRGSDGSEEYSTYDNETPESVVLDEASLEPVLWQVLQGSHVGAQIIFATFDYSTEPVDGVYSTILLALTVHSAVPVLDRATGEAVAPVSGLPTVTLAENGTPSVDFTGIEMPTGLVVQRLITGDGPAVVEGQSLTVHYSGWLWDGALFDSSWQAGYPATFALAQDSLIDGWVQGLAGQPVGSQVLLVIPPELAYGDAGQGSIPGGATLVFVVDILAAV
ncbi:MAG: FKBP-type peptidyl-prolyl cis-trans isomerase [Demequinaceae bacterium]|nr:FKBP-type peptidyl-prolyl cis-trans isomerase [Demequinaceae bacterium]